MPSEAHPGVRRAQGAVPISDYSRPAISTSLLLDRYKLRWKRRRYLWRAYRSARALTVVVDRTTTIDRDDILIFLCMRNEAERLPHFLDHYRALGAAHFLIIDNGSDDGSAEILKGEHDVSLWQTGQSYRSARFGMDWINHLLARYGTGHWCLTVDADELFVFREWEARGLSGLTHRLDADGVRMFGALMLDLYPNGPLGSQLYNAGDDPTAVLSGFDPKGYKIRMRPRLGNLWIQGGPRARAFFADRPNRAPTLNKTPLVRWHWRYAYVSSTHSLLPRSLNDWRGQENGLLLHTKFLPSITRRAGVEKARKEHFGMPEQFDSYYDAVMSGPNLWHDGTRRYRGWQDAEAAGLFRICDHGMRAEIYSSESATYVRAQQPCAPSLDAVAETAEDRRVEQVSRESSLGRD